MRLGILTVLLAILIALAVSPAANAKAMRCGRTKVHVNGHAMKAKVRIWKGKVSCTQAKRLARHYYERVGDQHFDGSNSGGVYYKIGGWTCNFGLAQSEMFCRRSGKRVDASTRKDDGWAF